MALTTPIFAGDVPLLLTASVGIAAVTPSENPLERADAQMYQAKRAAH